MSEDTRRALVVERCWLAPRTVASIAVEGPHLVSVNLPEGQVVQLDLETALSYANLFAAAPDMLAALKEWFDPGGGFFPNMAATERARAAIAKAERRR